MSKPIEQLERGIAEQSADLARFENENRWTKDDAHEGVFDWIGHARAFMGDRFSVEAFASGGDISRDSITTAVLTWAVSDTDKSFNVWLHDKIENAPTPGLSKFSPLSREQRDAELQRRRDEIEQLTNELAKHKLDEQQSVLDDERRRLLA